MLKKLADGREVEILPIGTLVYGIKYPVLTGIIERYEYHESGKLSALPYRVVWHDTDLARTILGNWYWWPDVSAIAAAEGKP